MQPLHRASRDSFSLGGTAGPERTVERRSFGLSANDGFAAGWQWTASATCTTNATDTGLATPERDTTCRSVTTGLSYRINDYLHATLQLRRSDANEDDIHTDIERGAVVVGVTGRWPVSSVLEAMRRAVGSETQVFSIPLIENL
jgi:hypothetical protein